MPISFVWKNNNSRKCYLITIAVVNIICHLKKTKNKKHGIRPWKINIGLVNVIKMYVNVLCPLAKCHLLQFCVHEIWINRKRNFQGIVWIKY